MAITISTLKAEVLPDLQESTSSTFLTDANFLGFTNDFYDEYGAELELQGGPTDYTWGATTTAVALTSVAATVMQVYKIEVKDSAGTVIGEMLPRPRGHADGFFVWGEKVWLNPVGTSPTAAFDTSWFYFKTPTAATTVTANVDIHSGFERSVMKPWYMMKAYEKMRKFAIAEGYRSKFERAFKKMKRDRRKQANPPHDTLVTSDYYGPLTG